MKRVLVTVGSTFFDELVDSALSDIVLEALHSRGAEEIAVQCGAYKGKNKELAGISGSSVRSWNERHGLQIELYAFKPNLTEEFMKADLVVSHAGKQLNFYVQFFDELLFNLSYRLWNDYRCATARETVDCSPKSIATG